MAGLVQYLSAKLGLVTGRTLPESVADRARTSSRVAYWLQAELVAMATDLAEVVGGAIALHLLFGLPLMVGGVITGAVSLALLIIKDRRGQTVFERVITGLLMVIAIGFLTSLLAEMPPVSDAAAGLVPRFDGAESILLAAAMLGATVMPHAVYLHSGLARDRHGRPENRLALHSLLRITRWDVGIAMMIAGAVNLSMLLVAATNLRGVADTHSIEGAYDAVQNALGHTVALLFAIGLLASGLASSSVGAYAGAMIMQGLLRRSVPLVARRLITLLPALAVLAAGVDPSRALVLSQVVLSFGIPFALIPLIRLTSDARVMGADVNHRVTTALGWGVATLITLLNVVLIYLTVTG
jgi:manganese transport protein